MLGCVKWRRYDKFKYLAVLLLSSKSIYLQVKTKQLSICTSYLDLHYTDQVFVVRAIKFDLEFNQL